MKTLDEIGVKFNTDKSSICHTYLEFYEKHLPKKVNRLLEIGIKDGASLRMWREYYPDAEIVGIDINPVSINGCVCLHLDATDVFQLKKLGYFDVIIDDGSHYTKDQQVAFNELFNNNLKQGGFYVMEDIHTSFLPHFLNTKRTTYDILVEKYPNNILYKRFKDDTPDSITMIIPKK